METIGNLPASRRTKRPTKDLCGSARRCRRLYEGFYSLRHKKRRLALILGVSHVLTLEEATVADGPLSYGDSSEFCSLIHRLGKYCKRVLPVLAQLL
ncbi:hypothetical protein L596_029731 [Steinernema carpocapsae]|uniref:Uncharacterized protein n=1 Tax=Steinernema carpocapsae TaxID=34508 RepID=A0A4U5LQN5_STECR|nr:hypothetical protein L596_029731 [Steinernema carpocapsae]